MRNQVPITFEQAKAQYVHRFTMEHIPAWSQKPHANGKFYAPQYRSDREWFENTKFPPNNPYSKKDCYSNNQTWPLGQWLDKPFRNTYQHEELVARGQVQPIADALEGVDPWTIAVDDFRKP